MFVGGAAADLARTFLSQWNSNPTNHRNQGDAELNQKIANEVPETLQTLDPETFQVCHTWRFPNKFYQIAVCSEYSLTHRKYWRIGMCRRLWVHATFVSFVP